MYAKDTTVSAERSRAEIEETLRRYGADQFASGWDADKAVIGFRCKGRSIRFLLVLPSRKDKAVTQTERRNQLRSPAEQDRVWEQLIRQRWRALALCIKAKLEAVQSGIETFDEAFLPHIVVPGTNNQTVSNWLGPQLEGAYLNNKAPMLLPFLQQEAK